MKLKQKTLWSDKELSTILDAHLPLGKLKGTMFSEKFTDACAKELFEPSPVYRATVSFEKLSPASDLLVYNPKKDFFSPTEKLCMDMEEGDVLLVADPKMPRSKCLLVLEKTSLPPSESGMFFSIPDSVGVHVVALSKYIAHYKLKPKEEGVVQWD